MTRRKFTTKFKTEVVLEALKERQSLADIARKYEIYPTQISGWKRHFLSVAETVFEKEKLDGQNNTGHRSDQLLKTIVQLRTENDFLKNALR
ncbi:transposase [uncultured Croceitalea sp.]|uniref:transposase n=1 Tax=uncultured Croceitalea sp. TaxID=1798908 RepID=UPI0033059869